jgi:5-methylcytosine-specific restriction endonuclease McrA
MQNHTKVYLEYFGFAPGEYIPCEICESPAVDIAHIIAQSKFGKKRKHEQDKIENLMALCRSCHHEYDFNVKWTPEYLTAIHLKKIKS